MLDFIEHVWYNINMEEEKILEQVSQLADELMAQYLPDWTWRFDKATVRYGCCRHNLKLITISKALASINSIEDTKDTILHEIAHALVDKKHNHDNVWKAKCIEIGAKPEARIDGSKINLVVKNTALYKAICPNCSRYVYRRRNTKRRMSCGYCSPRFDERYLLTFVKVGT